MRPSRAPWRSLYHVLHAADGTGYHADSTLYLNVDTLNAAFAGSQISFRVVGIHHVQNDLWFNNMYTVGRHPLRRGEDRLHG